MPTREYNAADKEDKNKGTLIQWGGSDGPQKVVVPIPTLYEIDFEQLQKEMKNYWGKMKSNPMLATAVKGFLLGVCFTSFDIYTDFQLGYDYFYGTNYTKYVATLDAQYVNNNESECVLVSGNTYTSKWNGSDWKSEDVIYEFSCFEIHPIYGSLTLACIFWPGLWIAAVLFYNVKSWTLKWLLFFCWPILVLFTPVILIVGQIFTMFFTGDGFTHVASVLAISEGMLEASPQILLQMFIMLSHADRRSTLFQWIMVSSSAFTINKPHIEMLNRQYLTDRIPKGIPAIVEQIKIIAKYLPLFATTTIFRVMTTVLVLVFFRAWGVVYYGAAGFVALFFALPILKISEEKDLFKTSKTQILLEISLMYNVITVSHVNLDDNLKRRFNMITIFIVQSLQLIAILVISNTMQAVITPEFFVDLGPFKAVHWADIPIASDIKILNIITSCTLGCGVVSLALCFYQLPL